MISSGPILSARWSGRYRSTRHSPRERPHQPTEDAHELAALDRLSVSLVSATFMLSGATCRAAAIDGAAVFKKVFTAELRRRATPFAMRSSSRLPRPKTRAPMYDLAVTRRSCAWGRSR